jgi:hypothetical protein
MALKQREMGSSRSHAQTQAVVFVPPGMRIPQGRQIFQAAEYGLDFRESLTPKILRVAIDRHAFKLFRFQNDSQTSQQELGLVVLGESFLLDFELLGMNASARTTMFDGMPQVKHFVIHHKIKRKTGCFRLIEYAADDDGVVTRVEVAEARSGSPQTPS